MGLPESERKAELSVFLEKLPNRTYESVIEMEADLISDLMYILGYEDENIFYDISYTAEESILRPDSVVSISPTNRPYLVIEAKSSNAVERPKAWEQTEIYKDATQADYGVIISPKIIGIIDSEGERHKYDLYTDEVDIDEILRFLSPPKELPQESLPSSRDKGETFAKDKFSKINLNDLEQKIKEVKSANSNEEKRKTLESTAEKLLKNIEGLKVNETNYDTESSEIDLIVENTTENKASVLSDYGRYILVECKNWKDSVGAKQIRDFKQKMENRHVDLGIFFAKNGISGSNNGEYAQYEIYTTYRKEKKAILVFDLKNLEDIADGTGVYEFIEEKLFALRFGN